MPYYSVPAVLSIHAADEKAADEIAEKLHESTPVDGVVLLVEDPIKYEGPDDMNGPQS